MAKRKHKQNSKIPPKKITSDFRIPEPTMITPGKQPSLSGDTGPLLIQWLSKHNKLNISQYPNLSTQQRMDMIQTEVNRYMYYKQIVMGNYLTALYTHHIVPDRIYTDKLDCIDLSFFGDKSNAFSAKIVNYRKAPDAFDYIRNAQNLQFYDLIPCFSEGMLKINTQRATYFKIKHIDETTKSLTVQLLDYMLNPEPNGLHEAGRGVLVQFNKTDTKIQTTIIKTQTFVDLYTKLSPRQLNWSTDDISIWEEVVLQNAVNQDVLFKNNGQNPEEQLAHVFLTNILLTNYYLAKQKPVTKRTSQTAQKKINQPFTTQIIDPVNPNKPIKRVRTIGTIQFISEKPPRKASEQTIHKYHIADWSVRGHTRTYKSGKTVYIKPHTNHRKAMDGHHNQPVQQILQIKDKGEIKHD